MNVQYNPVKGISRKVRFSIDSNDDSGSDLEDDNDDMPLIYLNADSNSFEMGENSSLVRPRRYRWPNQNIWDTIGNCCSSCCTHILKKCGRYKELRARRVRIGQEKLHGVREKFPRNIIRNQKFNIITFVPLVLFQQFKFFLNFFFLVMACSQFFPSVRIGYLYTYWAPLGFVIAVTMIREALDDFRRYRRDKEVNCQMYSRLTQTGVVSVPSAEITVGDIIIVEKDQRVPADLLLLRTTENTGACFIRTDQLDGETDWKLRLAVGATQALTADHINVKIEENYDIWKVPVNMIYQDDLLDIAAWVYAEKPQRDIHTFIGTFTRTDMDGVEESLSIENTMWANTVVASGTALGLVIYSGTETRAVMNTSQPKNKVGLIDLELNLLTKVLFIFVLILALVMMILKGFDGPWYRYMFRFVLLFSYIIPLSLRVNLDMGKAVYSWMIQRDKDIPHTVVRSTTIPEELGRIAYLLSDKTGTLTQNEMVFRRLHLGTVAYTSDTMDEVSAHLKTAFTLEGNVSHTRVGPVRKTVVSRVVEAVKAIALCHNVTPVYDSDDSEFENTDTEADMQSRQAVTYQASSPDEVALVSWTESVGLTLVKRDLDVMHLRTPHGAIMSYQILQIFPFTSESKRMGIIVREETTGEICYYMKGADVVMTSIVQYNDWLDEECGNLAREGLRTLVVAKKILSEEQYHDFEIRYHQAKMAIQDRSSKVQTVVESLERDLELLCLTGVEDKLQDAVRPTLEMLRNAGIKIWMLTGDKLETATCIAKSSKLVSRTQGIYTFQRVTNRDEAHLELNALRRKNDNALIIQGDSLQVCLQFYEHEFVELACQCPSVVVCRCSPTQKAEIVRLLKHHTGSRTAAVGDGGNDVSMIQAADAGIGIVGKEGRQASLAADFSINQFSFIGRLLLVHGRYSYMRSAALSQFVIHRGLIISVMQAIFSSVFYFASVTLFPSFLLVGYATVYTSLPVFSIVLDKDVSAEIAMTYPELYKDLRKGRSLSFKTFFLWVVISMYQGGVIMYGALLLFEAEFIHIVDIGFTSLLLTELLMVALTVRTWHYLMILAELISLAIYIASLAILNDFFDANFLQSWDFIWKVLLITSVSCIPIYVLKYLRRRFSPPSYSKLT